jgi:hypothetical protein
MTLSHRRLARTWARGLAFAALALFVANVACNNQPHQAHLAFDPPAIALGVGNWVDVDVVVDVDSGSLQAFDLDFQVSPATAAWIAEARLSEFDDDGAWFVAPVSDFLGGTMKQVIDLRHGDTALRGPVRLVRLRLVALEPGPASITVSSAGLAGAEGQSFAVTLDALPLDVSP